MVGVSLPRNPIPPSYPETAAFAAGADAHLTGQPLQLSLPARTRHERAATVDAKVMAIEDGTGARRAVVRVATVDWSTAPPMETQALTAR